MILQNGLGTDRCCTESVRYGANININQAMLLICHFQNPKARQMSVASSAREARSSPVHRIISPLQDAGFSICHLLMAINSDNIT